MEIYTYKGIGKLRFGMAAEEVRNKLKSGYKSFKKTPLSELPTDAFERLGIHVYYKKPGVCEAVELFGPADPRLGETELLGRDFSSIVSEIEKRDADLDFDETGFISYKLGIGVYAPGCADDPSTKIEGVIVFEKGYYD